MSDGTFTTAAPEGATFEFEEVKTKGGAESLGEVPILRWTSLEAARAQYGDEGCLSILDGTSARVSFQAIARRVAAKALKEGKTVAEVSNEIAAAQIAFRPGTRAVGTSTPVSRAKNVAGKAAEKVGGDLVAQLLARIASGELTEADVQALAN